MYTVEKFEKTIDIKKYIEGYVNVKEFEEFCKMMSGHKDIFYGTNKEVLLGKEFC